MFSLDVYSVLPKNANAHKKVDHEKVSQDSSLTSHVEMLPPLRYATRSARSEALSNGSASSSFTILQHNSDWGHSVQRLRSGSTFAFACSFSLD